MTAPLHPGLDQHLLHQGGALADLRRLAPDSTYFGLDPYEQVTAWVALTDASQDAGCIEVLSARGKPRQMRHVRSSSRNSINRTGQTITEPLDESDVRAMPLKAGQFSLHHTLCVHRSAPNSSPQRRVGLGINYIPAHVQPTGSRRMPALLVRGTDRCGHFDLYEPPVTELREIELATHACLQRLCRELPRAGPSARGRLRGGVSVFAGAAPLRGAFPSL